MQELVVVCLIDLPRMVFFIWRSTFEVLFSFPGAEVIITHGVIFFGAVPSFLQGQELVLLLDIACSSSLTCVCVRSCQVVLIYSAS